MISEPTMSHVIDIARGSSSKKRVGAILLYKNKIVATGVNKDTKTHPLQARFAQLAGLGDKIYLHAEIDALIKLRTQADTIVVARLGGHNGGEELRNAKPCNICKLALREAGIKKVCYTTDDGFLFEY